MDTSTETSLDKRANRRRISASFLVRAGISLILLGTGWLAIDLVVISRADITLPASLAGLPLTEKVTGQAALAEIEQLHNKRFPLTAGAIAYYEGGSATVWISSTWAPLLAARQVKVMTERIAEDRSPFTLMGTIEVENIPVYVLSGMGQMHYYFQRGQRVVWLAVPPQLAEQGLIDLIRNLP